MNGYRPHGNLYHWLGRLEHLISRWKVRIAWKRYWKRCKHDDSIMTLEQWLEKINAIKDK